MSKKKKISRAKFDLLFKDLKEVMACFGIIDVYAAENIHDVLEEHFDIVEIDPDEIECSPMGDGFAV